jgi:hypothetical protein
MQPDRNDEPPITPPTQPIVTLQPDAPASYGTDDGQDSYDDLSEPDSQPASPDDEPVHWQAYEYIHHEKNPLWFVLFAIVVLGFMAAAIFLIQSLTFAVLVPVMAAALLVYSHRSPRLLDYTLSRQGLHINDRLYSFAEFKGFGVIHDDIEYSIMLLPTKRFKLGVSVYFPEEAGEAIVDMLGTRLPIQDLHLDIVDRIIRKLRI